jgi:cytochrome c oxidase subunit 2
MSGNAAAYDGLYRMVLWGGLAVTAAVIVAIVAFVAGSRKASAAAGPRSQASGGRVAIFVSLALVPVIGLLFHLGFRQYASSAALSDGAVEIRVRARQWAWDFEYPGGMHETNTLMLPAGTPVKLILSSDDVTHSLYIPEFRLEKDIVPGMYTTMVFTPTAVGEAHILCAAYCGADHSSMSATVQVVTPAEYDAHVSGGAGAPPGMSDEAWGEKLFADNGCTACHAREAGAVSLGPVMKGVWRRKETMSTGAVVTVDEAYVRESVLQPQAKIVKGYEAIPMPTFGLTDKQIRAITAYLKKL